MKNILYVVISLMLSINIYGNSSANSVKKGIKCPYDKNFKSTLVLSGGKYTCRSTNPYAYRKINNNIRCKSGYHQRGDQKGCRDRSGKIVNTSQSIASGSCGSSSIRPDQFKYCGNKVKYYYYKPAKF